MLIQTLTTGPLKTNSYALIDQLNQSMCAIDVAPDSAKFLLEVAESHQVKIDAIWLTHSHWDHIADISALCSMLEQKANCPSIAIHPLDAPNLRNPGSDKISAPSIRGIEPDILLADGQELCLGPLRFHVLHTPGHSPGGVAYYNKKEKVLFSGDTLFKNAMGTLFLPTANPKLMPASLLKLAALPPETVVYPGHGLQTLIERERNWIKHRFAK